jgi:anti-anti-sigma regulatory factor
MRQSGVVTDVRRLGPHDHVCWGFDDESDFRAAAVAFLDAGLESGQRVWYVGEPSDGVHSALRGSRPGAVEVISVAGQYASGAVIDADDQVRAYAGAVADAVAAGFTGLRVATDVTALVREPAQLDAFARYEHQADRLMAASPFSAMCAYDRTALGADALAQLGSMHPLATGSATSFHLHATDRPGCVAALSGELDLASGLRLQLALDRAALRPVDGELVLDATGLTFVDGARLAAIADHARRLGAVLVLRTDQYVPRRLARMLAMDNVRIEAAS